MACRARPAAGGHEILGAVRKRLGLIAVDYALCSERLHHSAESAPTPPRRVVPDPDLESLGNLPVGSSSSILARGPQCSHSRLTLRAVQYCHSVFLWGHIPVKSGSKARLKENSDRPRKVLAVRE